MCDSRSSRSLVLVCLRCGRRRRRSRDRRGLGWLWRGHGIGVICVAWPENTGLSISSWSQNRTRSTHSLIPSLAFVRHQRNLPGSERFLRKSEIDGVKVDIQLPDHIRSFALQEPHSICTDVEVQRGVGTLVAQFPDFPSFGSRDTVFCVQHSGVLLISTVTGIKFISCFVNGWALL